MQSIDLIETYAYGRSKDLVSAKEEMKCNNIIKQTKKDKLWWCHNRGKQKKKNWPDWIGQKFLIIHIGNW